MIKFLPVIICTVIFTSCNFFQKKNQPAGIKEKMSMMDADRAFSARSIEKGVRKAYIEYIDSNGVLLRPNQYPLIGAAAVDFLSQVNDTTFTLQWEPKGGTIAKSGELGFTYGIYALKPTDKDTIIYGTYVNVWKKQANGSWKFILDTGNEGVSAAEENL
jgi:ketosteroid isomerase-like protein